MTPGGSSPAHLAAAALYRALVLSTPFRFKLAPFAEMAEAGRFTPFLRMHAANLESCLARVGTSGVLPVRATLPVPEVLLVLEVERAALVLEALLEELPQAARRRLVRTASTVVASVRPPRLPVVLAIELVGKAEP